MLGDLLCDFPARQSLINQILIVINSVLDVGLGFDHRLVLVLRFLHCCFLISLVMCRMLRSWTERSRVSSSTSFFSNALNRVLAEALHRLRKLLGFFDQVAEAIRGQRGGQHRQNIF